MPSSVAFAIAGAVVADAVGGGIIGAVIGSLVVGTLNATFADRPKSQSRGGTAEQRQQLITVRQATAPWQWIYGQARVGGIVTFMESTANNSVLHMVITLAGHRVEEIGDIWFDDEVVPLDGSGNATGRYAGYVTVLKSLGDEADGTQPFPALVAESAGKWTNSHKQARRAKIYVRLAWNQDLFPKGIPNITAVVKGKRVYDPRSGLTAWSNNADLCIADYLMADSSVGLGCVLADEIDASSLTAAANVDDEAVSLSGGGTEARYTLDGAFDVNATPREVLGRLLTANAGRLRYVGGRWKFQPAAYATPTVTIDADDLRAPLHILPRLPKRDLANGVKGVFISSGHNWQPTDFPPVTSAAYLAEDNSERIWRELDLPYTKSVTRCQRIAKIELERVRRQITVEWPGKFTCYQLEPGDTVQVIFSKYGWSSKVFEVKESTLVFEDAGDASGGVRVGCDLVLREMDSAVFGWLSAEEGSFAAATPSNLPDPFTVAAPTALAFNERDYMLTGEGYLTWTDSVTSQIKEYQPEYKVSSDSAWTPLPPVKAGDQQKRITGLPTNDSGEQYQFRVRAVNMLGVRSPWSTTLNATLTAPAVPNVSGLELFASELSLSFEGKDAKFVWRAASRQDSYDIGSEPLGASSGARDPYFKDYLVRIYNSDGSLRREEPENAVTEPRYTYTYEKNREDGTTPVREFTIKVWARGRQNQISPYPAQLPASNPQSGQPSAVTLRAEFNSIFLDWQPPAADTDLEGILVHVSTSNGFTPSGTTPGTGTCKYKGPDRLVVIDGLVPGTTYYVKAACYDVFGTDSLTYTTQLSVTTEHIESVDLSDLAVTTAKLADLAVTLGKLAADSVDSSKIVAAAVAESELATSAVTTTKIADDAVSTPKLVALVVTTAKLDALAVTTAKIDALAITTAKIAAGAVTANEIGAAAVTTAKLDAGAVTAEKITAGAVTADKIDANAVTADKIAANAVTAAKILAGTITADKMNVSTLAAIAADLGTITAGTITLNSSGHIKSGATGYGTGSGWWIGYDSGEAGLYIGDSSDYIKYKPSTGLKLGVAAFDIEIAEVLSSLMVNAWTQEGSVSAIDRYGVCYGTQAATNANNGNGAFVLVGAAGVALNSTDKELWWSEDGQTWVEATHPKNFALNAVCEGSNGSGGKQILAVGDADGSDAYIVRNAGSGLGSASWGECSNPKNLALYGVAYSPTLGSGSGRYCAVGAADGASDVYIITSDDGGVNWTERSGTGEQATLRAIVWDATLALFIACGQDAAATPNIYIATSPDGITWTKRTISAPTGPAGAKGIASNGKGTLAIVGFYNTNQSYILSSTNGTSWTSRSVPGGVGNQTLNAVASNGSIFVAVGEATSGQAAMCSSSDGVYWTSRVNPRAFALNGIGSSGRMFVAVGDVDASKAYVARSVMVS